jgi:hypothetical protein
MELEKDITIKDITLYVYPNHGGLINKYQYKK